MWAAEFTLISAAYTVVSTVALGPKTDQGKKKVEKSIFGSPLSVLGPRARADQREPFFFSSRSRSGTGATLASFIIPLYEPISL
eukprot:COSAG02_NODE_323_length_24725_cov_57.558272_15_plen_84_part_00